MRKKSWFFFVYLVFILYFAVSFIYYHSPKYTRHSFDPYLQCPNERFREPATAEKGTFRILCLGGSTTRCGSLPENSRYPKVLQTILQERYRHCRIEVLNAGMDWYTTKHSLIDYVTYGRYQKPDLVIVMQGINDMHRSFSPPLCAVGEYDELWTHFYGPSIYGARADSFEAHALKAVLLRLNKLLKINISDAFAREVEYPLGKYVSVKMFTNHLRTIIKYVQADKADIILVTQPSLYKDIMSERELKLLWTNKILCNTQLNLFRAEYPSSRSLCYAMRMFNNVIKNVALSEKIPYVDADNSVTKDLNNFIDDCHYTEKGARTVARCVADRIISAGYVNEKSYNNIK